MTWLCHLSSYGYFQAGFYLFGLEKVQAFYVLTGKPLYITSLYGYNTINRGKGDGVMLEPVLGNVTIEKVLFFLLAYGEGYAKQMADVFGVSINGIQQQLRRLEEGGVIVSQLKGKTRIFRFNPNYVFLTELQNLLSKAMKTLPRKDIEMYYRKRTRPRKTGKPF